MTAHNTSDIERLKTPILSASLSARDFSATVREAVNQTLALLDQGAIRVATPQSNGTWYVHEWVKKAILLYFKITPMTPMEAGPFQYHDKIPLKQDILSSGVRVVPPAAIRYGAFVETGAIVMPSYINIGAYVGAGTMVDNWVTVGSCAQVGRKAHLSANAVIGGVLEPINARPVIIEDDVFIGSGCVIVEGVHVGAGAVIAAGVVLTASTPIIDVRGAEAITTKGFVSPRAVVIPGQRPKDFPSGVYHVPCALIIGERGVSTDKKTSLTDVLREFDIPS